MEVERKRLGDFEIVRVIGRGGMGTVYEANQLSLNRRVALKVLRQGVTSAEQDIARFRREAEAAARLHHANIVPIYAQGEHHGTYYYAMQYVEGRSLDKVIADTKGTDVAPAVPAQFTEALVQGTGTTSRPGRAEPGEGMEGECPEAPVTRAIEPSRRYLRTVARMVAEAAQALEYAHGEGVVHRDIKPHNLMLTPTGQVVITDFGLARFLDQPGLTVTGEMMGTPVYMSPEQVAAQRVVVDHRTDIYSLGVTLYELLTLRVPFEGSTRDAVLRQILVKEPTPLRRVNHRIPKSLETICLKAMEKDPDRRYQRAGDVAGDLRAFLEGMPISARPIGPLGRVRRWALRHRAVAAALVGALVALIVGTYFGIQSYRDRQGLLSAKREEQAMKRRAQQLLVRSEEKRRWDCLERGRQALRDGRFTEAKEHFLNAARIRCDHSVLMCLYALRSKFCDHASVSVKTYGGTASSTALSLGGKTFAFGAEDHTVRVWDVETGRELRSLAGHTGTVNVLALSPDEKLLASGGEDRTLRLWGLATGEQLRSLSGHADTVTCLAFGPDGKVLASGNSDGTVRVWDVGMGRELRALVGHTSGATSLAFSPDGTTVASGSEDTAIRFWDLATGEQVRTIPAQGDHVHSVALSPDGQTLAACGLRDIKLWKVATGLEVRALGGHKDRVVSLAFSPDGKALASGGRDHTVRLWDLTTGQQLLTLAENAESVTAVTFGSDISTIVSASLEGNVRVWDSSAGRERRVLEGHKWGVLSIAFDPRGETIASGGRDGAIRLWEVATGRELRVLLGHADWVRSVAFSPDGKTLASGSRDNTVRLWDVDAGTELRTFAGHESQVASVAFSPDGRTLASGSLDRTIRLWDVASGGALGVLAGHTLDVLAVAFSPDGQALASGGRENIVRLWDVATGAQIRTLAGHTDWVQSLAFSPNGRVLASASRDGTIRVWDASTGKELGTLSGHTRSVQSVAFSPDGRMLASESEDRTIRLWDVAEGKAIATVERPDILPWSIDIAFSPDGRRLACTAAENILIFDLHAYDEDIGRWLQEVGIDVDLSEH